MRVGPTTETVTLSSGERMAFAPELLQETVADFPGRFMAQTVEHLGFLPPIGRITDMWLAERNGHQDLMARGRDLDASEAPDMVAPDVYEQTTDDSLPELSLSVGFEPRNFEARDARALTETAPIDVQRKALHADLPPLIWTITLGLGGVGLAGLNEYLKSFAKVFGEAHANGLLTWLRSSSRRAKQSHRENLLEVSFTVDDVRVVAYNSFHPDAAESFLYLEESVRKIASLGTPLTMLIDGDQTSPRLVAFYWHSGRWHLAWWCSDEATHVTRWFKKNAPAPELFLGRPLLAGRSEIAKHMGGRYVDGVDTPPSG